MSSVKNDGKRLAARIESLCKHHGMSQQSLAQEADISRTLFSSLKSGRTQWPHPKTLNKIAQVFGMSCEDLCDFSSLAKQKSSDSQAEQTQKRINQQTNPVIAQVVRELPELFQGWQQDEWDEIYSCFGVGGALSEEGVKEVARQINQRQELIRRVSILFETEHHDELVVFVDHLYQSVKPSNLLNENKLNIKKQNEHD